MATTGNASAQNNVVTAAEYQAAADEITAILAAQRAERAPIEAQQELLRNRQELLIARRQSALNTLQAAEAAPSETAFLEASRTAYARATGEVEAVNFAIQQNRSVLGQSLQASAELQDQRTNLEVKADFAERSPPNLNSLTPPATTAPDQSASYVAPPAPPVRPDVTPQLLSNEELLQIYPETDPKEVGAVRGTAIISDEARRILSDPAMIQQQLAQNSASLAPVPPTTSSRDLSDEETTRLFQEIDNPPAAANNRTTRAEYQAAADEVFEIQSAARATSAQYAEQVSQNQAAYTAADNQATALRREYLAAEAAGASSTELASLAADYEAQIELTTQLGQQLSQSESALATNQAYRQTLAAQENYLFQQASQAAAGPPGLNSVPGPGTEVPDQSVSSVTEAQLPVARSFSAQATETITPADPQPSGLNNVTTAAEYQAAADEVFEIQSAARATSAQLADQVSQNQAAYTAADNRATQLRREYLAAEAAGASSTELASLAADYEAQIETTTQLGQQLNQSESALAANQQYRQSLAAQENYLFQQASQAASGPPGLNSVPGPGTEIPDQAVTAVTEQSLSLPSTFSSGDVSGSGDEAIAAYEEALLAQQEGQAFAPPTAIPADGDAALVAYEEALLAQQEGQAFAISTAIPTDGDEALVAFENAQFIEAEAAAFAPRNINDPLYGLTPEQIQLLGGADPTDPYIRARLGIPQLPGSELVATGGFGTFQTGVPLIDNAIASISSFFRGRPTPAAAPVPASGDEALQAAQDAETAQLAAQEGTAFAEPVTLDDPEVRAIQDAIDADLAAQEGTAFAEPVTLDDPEARAIQDAIDADLAAQEGQAFPPVEAPTPVDPNDVVTAFQDVEAAELAALEGSAFVVDEPLPVDVGSDEELRAIEDAQAADLAAQEGTAFAEPVTLDDPEARAIQDAIDADLAEQEASAFGPAPVTDDPAYGAGTADEQAAINQAIADQAAGSATAAKTANAQRQSTLQSRKNQPSAADWRVRLQLAPGANYLYAASDKASRGILAPLYDTDGVIFPYTPSIETAYKAKYAPYDLIHSNYRGYFYQSSSVDEIQIKGTFTAQDTREAQYLLAVIHFFRSVTKMFYGQDSQAGTPPPLVYLSGLGQYQFNNHPCLVSNFNYSLPTDVDYIRADGFNNIGLNLENRRSLGSGPALGGAVGTVQRLVTNGLTKGAQRQPPVPGPVNQNVTNQNSINSTYVPTKMEITLSLLPVQTRNQVSQQFSLAGFAQGRLLQGGFW